MSRHSKDIPLPLAMQDAIGMQRYLITDGDKVHTSQRWHSDATKPVGVRINCRLFNCIYQTAPVQTTLPQVFLLT